MVFQTTGMSSHFQCKNWFWKICTESQDINQNKSKFRSPNQNFIFPNKISGSSLCMSCDPIITFSSLIFSWILLRNFSLRSCIFLATTHTDKAIYCHIFGCFWHLPYIDRLMERHNLKNFIKLICYVLSRSPLSSLFICDTKRLDKQGTKQLKASSQFVCFSKKNILFVEIFQIIPSSATSQRWKSLNIGVTLPILWYSDH